MKNSKKINELKLKKAALIGLAAVLPAGIGFASCSKKAQKEAENTTQELTTEQLTEDTNVVEVTEDGKIKLKPLSDDTLEKRGISVDKNSTEANGKGINGGAGAAGAGTKTSIEAQDPHVSNGNGGNGSQQPTTRTEIIPEETRTEEPKPVDYPTTEEKEEPTTEKVTIIEKEDPEPELPTEDNTKTDPTTEQQTTEKETVIIIDEEEEIPLYDGDVIEESNYSSKNNIKRLFLHI